MKKAKKKKRKQPFKKLTTDYKNDKFTYTSYQKNRINTTDNEINIEKITSDLKSKISRHKNFDALSFTLGSTIKKRVRKKGYESVNLGRSSGFIQKESDEQFIESKLNELFDVMSEFFESYNDDDGKLSSRLKLRINFIKFKKDTVKPVAKNNVELKFVNSLGNVIKTKKFDSKKSAMEYKNKQIEKTSGHWASKKAYRITKGKKR